MPAARSVTRANDSPTERYPIRGIARRARLGADAVYPFEQHTQFGAAVLGSDVYATPQRFPSLDQLLLVPPLFTPKRLQRMRELQREPLYTDVSTDARLGGFEAPLPVLAASMGSTDVVNKVGLVLSEGAARIGMPLGIGENVATVWGYRERVKPSQPCFTERALTYLRHLPERRGGLLIQQSVEDAYDELWNRVYSDPELSPFIAEGRVGFEIKLGQGAKPGLGGEILVGRRTALRLQAKFHFPDDPARIVKPLYARHSAPGTYTPDILRSQLRLMRNNYPRCRLWLKLGPYRDLAETLKIAEEEGVDGATIDGKEGGTGMSPQIAMQELGLPTVVCLALIRRAKQQGVRLTLAAAGGLYDGGHILKALALGADGIGLGRPFVIAAHQHGAVGVSNYVAALRAEAQMLASALGHYRLKDVNADEDLVALTTELAAQLGVRSLYTI